MARIASHDITQPLLLANFQHQESSFVVLGALLLKDKIYVYKPPLEMII